MQFYTFEVKIGDRRRILSERSKHLRGAIRKLYQEHKFDEIVRII